MALQDKWIKLLGQIASYDQQALTRHELRSLERDEHRRVIAAIVQTPAGEKRIMTTRGGVLAAGSLVPQADGSTRPFPHLLMDRAKPSVIAVGQDGRRFTNEALSYHDFVQNMVAKLLSDKQKSAWLICDHAALRRYGLGAVPCAPGRIGSFLHSGYLKTGATAAELAQVTGINSAELADTIEQFNGPAALLG